MDTAAIVTRSRLQVGLVVVALCAYEAYALFVKRGGETRYLPAEAETQLSPEVAGAVALEQTFVMHADGLDAIYLYPHPSTDAPAGAVQLLLIGDNYAEPVARQKSPASDVAAADPFVWVLPRIDRSSGRTFTLRVTVPDALPGHGLRFELGTPRYTQGELSFGGRSFWGDLKFETRAARVRLIDSLAAFRRQAPPILRSDAVLVAALVLFNWALVTIVVRLAFPRPLERPAAPADTPS